MSFYKWSKTAATNASADPAVNWSEGMAPSAVNDSARGEMASNAKWRDDISGTLTTTGSSTAYALATNQVFSTAALMSGAMITFIPHTTSGAAPTLAVDGLTARAINKATGVAVATGALIAGTPYVVSYIHASTEFILQGYSEVFGSPTFTGNLTVNGTTTLTGAVTFSAALKGADGTVSLPEYSFTNDTDCGIYRIGANNLGMAVNGAKVLDIGTTGLGVTGLVTISSTLGVTGKATFSGLANFASAAYASTTAGDIEYDGKAFANNPVASSRGISPSVHFCRSSSDQSGANDTSSQVWFKSGVNALTVAANTTYFFEGVLYLTRAAGTTAHTTSVGLNAGATFTSCNWLAEATSSTGNILAPISSIRADSNAFVVVTPSNSAATENVTIRISGIMAIANAGTIQPVFLYSVAPGGVPTIKANSYFRCYPVGVDTVVSVGNWS